MIKNEKSFTPHITFYKKLCGGFTLVELLIVMGILAILAVVVILVINPSEYFKQARDSARMSELQELNKAIGQYQADGGTNLGLTNKVYVSIPDATSTCANLGLPTLPSGWEYRCSNSDNYRKVNGTGWVPVPFTSISWSSNLSILPIDPVNTTSSGNYYTYIPGGSWKIQAVLESDKYRAKARNDSGTASEAFEVGSDLSLASAIFPSYWVKVPGNSSFGTSDFWVMKHEAKCVQASNNTPLTSPDTSYHTYSNSGQPCTGSSYYIASTPDGYPIANISHNTALSYCTALGAHLLTNDEYMTIVRNAEQVSSNWSGNSPGSGYMYSGHNDNIPALALTASQDDAQGYFGETNTGGNQRRTLILSNGSVVWDFAGNVWQHVQRSTMNSGDNTNTITTPTCSSGSSWCEYAGAGVHITAWNDASFSAATVGPANGSWYSAQGIGQVYPATGAISGSVFLRGGYWSDGSLAGAFTLTLNWRTGTANSHVGFRCAR